MRAEVLLALAIVVGCASNDDDLIRSAEDLEHYLIAEVGRTSGDLKVGNVDCPSQLPTEVGASVECRVELGEVGVRYTVQRLEGERVQMKPSDPIVDIDGAEAAVMENIGSGVTVDCGAAKVVQKKVGGRVPCTVTPTEGATRKVELVVEDESGRVKAVDA